MVVAALAAATMLAGIPTVHRLRGWFWPLREVSLNFAWLAATAALVAMLATVAYRARRYPGCALWCVFGIAGINQYGLALAEGRGLDALRERAAYTGHSEFVRIAATGWSAGDILRSYELLATPREHPYLAVKPPGQLLTYVALDRLAQCVVPDGVGEGKPIFGVVSDRHRRLIELLAWLLPWLAAAAVFPIGGVARALIATERHGAGAGAGEQLRGAAWLAIPLLFAVAAPTTLITLHLDQALYPLATAPLWWCAIRGAGRSERAGECVGAPADRCALRWGFAAGVVAWASIFLSFGLLPAVVLAPCLVATVSIRRTRSTLLFAASTLVVGVAMSIAFYAAYGYDPLQRYQRVMAAHAGWKSWSWTLAHTARASSMNLLEFAWWANPAFALACGAGMLNALRRLCRSLRTASGLDLLTLVTTLLLVVMAALGQTFAETARLWLFLLPLTIWIGVRALGAVRAREFALLLALQWTWTTVLKHTQDFH